MNLIIDDAEEVYIGKAASKPHRPLGEHFVSLPAYPTFSKGSLIP